MGVDRNPSCENYFTWHKTSCTQPTLPAPLQIGMTDEIDEYVKANCIEKAKKFTRLR
jgi:hypothetical protein